MEAARWSARAAASRLERTQLALLGVLLALAVVAWLVTQDRMGGMESVPGMSLGALGFFVTVWVVMMAAMMFPSVAPTVLMYDRLREGHRARGKGAAADATALFVAGYLLVWTAAGLAAYALFELVRAIDPAFLAWDDAGRYVTGGVIVAAAIYQVTPLKTGLPGQVPQPDDVPRRAVAQRPGRCRGVGGAARRLVSRLLLGTDGGAVRSRHHEPRLDGAGRRVHRR